MAEGRKRWVAAVLLGLLTMVLAAAGGWLAYSLFDFWVDEGDAFGLVGGLVDAAGTMAVLVVGGLAVVRLARGRRVGAVRVVFITLVLAAVIAIGGLFLVALDQFWSCFGAVEPCGGGFPVAILVVAAVVLVGGLLAAWRVRARDRAETRPVEVAELPLWLVAEEGADLKEYPSQERVISHLEGRTPVREVRRFYEYVRVLTPAGREGWVAADRLVAPHCGNGEADG